MLSLHWNASAWVLGLGLGLGLGLTRMLMLMLMLLLLLERVREHLAGMELGRGWRSARPTQAATTGTEPQWAGAAAGLARFEAEGLNRCRNCSTQANANASTSSPLSARWV